MSPKIGTACLPTQNQVLPSETPCYFAAWGIKNRIDWSNQWWSKNQTDVGVGHNRRLRETDLPMLTDEECKA